MTKPKDTRTLRQKVWACYLARRAGKKAGLKWVAKTFPTGKLDDDTLGASLFTAPPKLGEYKSGEHQPATWLACKQTIIRHYAGRIRHEDTDHHFGVGWHDALDEATHNHLRLEAIERRKTKLPPVSFGLTVADSLKLHSKAIGHDAKDNYSGPRH